MHDNSDQVSEEVSAKELTKQMLLNCKVFRKRNNNVTPIRGQTNNMRNASPVNYFEPFKLSSAHDTAEDVPFADPANMNSRDLRDLMGVVRTAATGTRHPNENYDHIANNRASTCENQGNRT